MGIKNSKKQRKICVFIDFVCCIGFDLYRKLKEESWKPLAVKPDEIENYKNSMI